MKFFLTIFLMALVTEVTFAASLARPKRQDADTLSPYLLTKQLLVPIMYNVKVIVTRLPDTPAFRKYKDDLKDIVEYYETENEDVFCFQKQLNVLNRLKEFEESLSQNQSPEAKHVLRVKEQVRDVSSVQAPDIEPEDLREPTVEEILEMC